MGHLFISQRSPAKHGNRAKVERSSKIVVCFAEVSEAKEGRGHVGRLPPLERSVLFLVSDRGPYFSLELRSDFSYPMLLCVLGGVLQYFLFGVPSYDMCASGRRINFGALDDFGHGNSCLSGPDNLG